MRNSQQQTDSRSISDVVQALCNGRFVTSSSNMRRAASSIGKITDYNQCSTVLFAFAHFLCRHDDMLITFTPNIL